jgi:hypothetical protein
MPSREAPGGREAHYMSGCCEQVVECVCEGVCVFKSSSGHFTHTRKRIEPHGEYCSGSAYDKMRISSIEDIDEDTTTL